MSAQLEREAPAIVWRPAHRDHCSRCWCDADDRTTGCPSCGSRHRKRRARGSALPVVEYRAVECVGCGCELDASTDGCLTCRHRHELRKRRRLRRERARDSIRGVPRVLTSMWTSR